MKKFIALLLSSFLALSVNAQGIEFQDLSFSEALELAKEEDKAIFMDCYTTWCGPCKWMSSNIFTLEEIGEYYNNEFICVKFDMEKGEGLKLADRYSVKAYPTLLYINADGELLNVSVGANQDPESYIAAGEFAMDPQRNMPYLAANKEENFDNPEFMMDYFNTFGAAGRLEEGELAQYFDQFDVEEWTQDGNWNIIQRNAQAYESDIFQNVLEQEDLFVEAQGERAQQFIDYVVLRHLRRAYYIESKKDNGGDFASVRKEVLNGHDLNNGEELSFKVDLMVFESEEKWEEYCESCQENIKKYYWDNANELNSLAWNVFENSKDKKNLEMAMVWAERANKLEPENHFILDTYANLLFVNGFAEKALTIEKKALSIAKENGDDPASYKAVIDKIKEAMKS